MRIIKNVRLTFGSIEIAKHHGGVETVVMQIAGSDRLGIAKYEARELYGALRKLDLEGMLED